jgi:hypothetical protein
LAGPTKSPYRTDMVVSSPEQGHTKTVGAYPPSWLHLTEGGAQPGNLKILGVCSSTHFNPLSTCLVGYA